MEEPRQWLGSQDPPSVLAKIPILLFSFLSMGGSWSPQYVRYLKAKQSLNAQLEILVSLYPLEEMLNNVRYANICDSDIGECEPIKIFA